MTAFEQAQKDVQTLSQKPANPDLLDLYALFKQATVGDVKGDRPSLINLTGRLKYDAWSAIKGMSQTDAETAYIQKVNGLLAVDRR